MVVNDAPSLLAACLSGDGIAQPLELYSREALRSGKIIRILPEWNQERYPLYAYLPSRRHPPAKVRLILSFIERIASSDPLEAASESHRSSSTSVGKPCDRTSSGRGYREEKARKRLYASAHAALSSQLEPVEPSWRNKYATNRGGF